MHVVSTSRLTGLALLCALLAATIIAPDALRAQPTGFAAGQLILQDTSGHSITLQAPAGLTSSYNYILPASPGADIPAGFVAAGAYLGQTLYWNGSYWQPTTFIDFNGAAIGLGFSGQPAALPFPVTLNADLGPATDYQHDLGDPTHRFRNIYAQAIIGPDGLSNAAQFSAITSGTNDNAAMYVATGASIIANGGVVQATYPPKKKNPPTTVGRRASILYLPLYQTLGSPLG